MNTNIKRFAATVLLGTAMSTGIAAGFESVAAADPKPDALSSTGKWYTVDLSDACRVQYSYSRNSLDGSIYATKNLISGPYDWYCARNQWSLSVPAGVGFTVNSLGSIDVQRYCDTFYKNTAAKTDGYYWFCDKRR
ncbi:hypothetical protein [Nocardia sp. NBC_01388]|uniref:hypothetical protein n=1 Tax=Nocardia sp. NBC_01388 TaxID=2903596 RepID=UPI003247C1E7